MSGREHSAIDVMKRRRKRRSELRVMVEVWLLWGCDVVQLKLRHRSQVPAWFKGGQGGRSVFNVQPMLRAS